MGRHVVDWIQTLIQRQNGSSLYDANTNATTTTISTTDNSPPSPRNLTICKPVTSVSFKGVDSSDWEAIIHSLDFLTLRQLTIFESNITNDDLTALIDRCLTTVNETKAIELLRTMDPVSNWTPVEERAVMDLRRQEGYGVGGQDGLVKVTLRKNRGVSLVRLTAEQERLASSGVWWCKLE